MDVVLTPNPTGSASTVPTSMDEFSFHADVAMLNPTHGLLDSVQYTVALAATAVKDGVQIAYAGITGTNYEFAVMDQVAPTLSTYSPSRVVTGVSTAGNLMFSFSETVQLGSMDVVLNPNPTGSASTVPISLDEFSFYADVATLNPTNGLLDSVQYTVVLAATAVKDGVQIAYAGITGTN